MSNHDLSNHDCLHSQLDSRGVLWLSLNRPRKHNALNPDLIAALSAASARADASSAVRLVVLSGRGDSFCSGADFNWSHSASTLSRAERLRHSEALAECLQRWHSVSVPVIGCIQGGAYGGGLGLISVCDVAIGVSSAQFAWSEVRLGLVPATIAPFVVARIGVREARRWLLSGARFGAEKARRMGLLHEVVAEQALAAAVESEIEAFLQAAPSALATTKALIDYVAHHDAADNRRYTADRLADAWESEEGRAGIAAFLQGTPRPWV